MYTAPNMITTERLVLRRKAVFAWAASCGEVCRIWATCDVENTASTRVLAKLGMVREGILRRWAIRPTWPLVFLEMPWCTRGYVRPNPGHDSTVIGVDKAQASVIRLGKPIRLLFPKLRWGFSDHDALVTPSIACGNRRASSARCAALSSACRRE